MGRNNIPLEENVVNQIISIYKEGALTSREVAAKLGISKATVLKYLKKNDVKRREKKKRREYYLNDVFFQNFENWGEKESYFAGFIMGDGYNCLSRGFVKIALSAKDFDFLKMLSGLIQDKNSFYENKESWKPNSIFEFRIQSPQVCKDLLKIGICQNKTIECCLPDKLLSEDNMRHFIRGLIDADGCFSTPHNGKYLKFSFSGNFTMCQSMVDYLSGKLGFRVNKVNRDARSNIGCEFSIFGAKKVFPLYEFLYKDAIIFLKRKKDVCDFYFKNTSSSARVSLGDL